MVKRVAKVIYLIQEASQKKNGIHGLVGGHAHWCKFLRSLCFCNCSTATQLFDELLKQLLPIVQSLFQEKPAVPVAWWYSGGHKLEMIIALAWIAYPPS